MENVAHTTTPSTFEAFRIPVRKSIVIDKNKHSDLLFCAFLRCIEALNKKIIKQGQCWCEWN